MGFAGDREDFGKQRKEVLRSRTGLNYFVRLTEFDENGFRCPTVNIPRGMPPALPRLRTPSQLKILNMKMSRIDKKRLCAPCFGFTLTETCVAVAVVGVFLVSLCSGLTMGTTVIRASREHERATQVMVEKFEAIRLYTWDQITNTTFIPTNFTAPFDPTKSNGGLTYTGTLIITNTSITGSYSNDLKKVKVQLTWPSGSVTITQSMVSFVARYGMQNYIY
jgi:type II secretory pathway pseudopilin PulG